MEGKVRLSEIVAAATDAIGSGYWEPGAALARELILRAGWRWGFTSWEDLIERISDGDLPEPGLRNVDDDDTD